MFKIQRKEIGVSLSNLPKGTTAAHIKEVIALAGLFGEKQNSMVHVDPEQFIINVLEPFQNRQGFWQTRIEVRLSTLGFMDVETKLSSRLTITESESAQQQMLNSFNSGIYINVSGQGSLAIAMVGDDAKFLQDGSRSCYYHSYMSRGRECRQPFLRVYAEPFRLGKSTDVEARADRSEVAAQAKHAEVVQASETTQVEAQVDTQADTQQPETKVKEVVTTSVKAKKPRKSRAKSKKKSAA